LPDGAGDDADPNRLEHSHPAGTMAAVSFFSRIAFGFKFMFSPVSAKTEVNESNTASAPGFHQRSTQWKSPRSRQRVSKKCRIHE